MGAKPIESLSAKLLWMNETLPALRLEKPGLSFREVIEEIDRKWEGLLDKSVNILILIFSSFLSLTYL